MGENERMSPTRRGSSSSAVLQSKEKMGGILKESDAEKTLSSDEIHLRAISAIHGGRLGKFKAAKPMAQGKERVREYLRMKK